MHEEILALIPVSAFALIGFIAWVIHRTRVDNRSTEAMTSLHSRMIDKFSSSEEFVKFLQTPEGQRYLSSFTDRPEVQPAEKVISSVKTGIILTMISIGFIGAGVFTGYEVRENPSVLLGFVGLFLGGGFILSAIAAHRLSKALEVYGEADEAS